MVNKIQVWPLDVLVLGEISKIKLTDKGYLECWLYEKAKRDVINNRGEFERGMIRVNINDRIRFWHVDSRLSPEAYREKLMEILGHTYFIEEQKRRYIDRILFFQDEGKEWDHVYNILSEWKIAPEELFIVIKKADVSAEGISKSRGSYAEIFSDHVMELHNAEVSLGELEKFLFD